MASKLFEVMALLESRGIWFRIQRAATTSAVLVCATLVGVRLAVVVGENDEVTAYVFRGDESVEVGMDAVRRVLDDDQAPEAAPGSTDAPFPVFRQHRGDTVFQALYQNTPRPSKMFDVLEELEKHRLASFVETSSSFLLVVTALTAGRWIEIEVDLDDMVDVCVLRSAGKSLAGLDAIIRLLDEEEYPPAT